HTTLFRSICIGPPKSSDSYLDNDRILQAEDASGADAIHPGYGLLSETTEFARRCEEAGIMFVGTDSSIMKKMGDKAEARQTVREAGIPVMRESEGVVESIDEVKEVAEDIGFPIVIKAVFGGGGKGMRFVHDEQTLEKQYKNARKEAKNAFGDDRIYVEKYI